MAKKVFISYTHTDQMDAIELSDKLQAHDIDYIIDLEALKIGDQFREFISQTIHETDYTIFIISEDSLKSPWFMLEFWETYHQQNVQQKEKIIPLVKDKTFFGDKHILIMRIDETIEEEKEKLKEQREEANKKGYGSQYYDNRIQRLESLKMGLETFMRELDYRLIADFSSQAKKQKNLSKLIEKLEGKNYDTLLIYNTGKNVTRIIQQELTKWGIKSWDRDRGKYDSSQAKKEKEEQKISVIKPVVVIIKTDEDWEDARWKTLFKEKCRGRIIPVLAPNRSGKDSPSEIPEALQQIIKDKMCEPIRFSKKETDIAKDTNALENLYHAIKGEPINKYRRYFLGFCHFIKHKLLGIFLALLIAVILIFLIINYLRKNDSNTHPIVSIKYPNISTIHLESKSQEEIPLEADITGEEEGNLRFQWKSEGPGKLQGDVRSPSIVYVPPAPTEVIPGTFKHVTIAIQITDEEGKKADADVTFKLIPPLPTPISEGELLLVDTMLDALNERLEEARAEAIPFPEAETISPIEVEHDEIQFGSGKCELSELSESARQKIQEFVEETIRFKKAYVKAHPDKTPVTKITIKCYADQLDVVSEELRQKLSVCIEKQDSQRKNKRFHNKEEQRRIYNRCLSKLRINTVSGLISTFITQNEPNFKYSFELNLEAAGENKPPESSTPQRICIIGSSIELR